MDVDGLIKLQCTNCKGRLKHYENDIYECEYCGTLYKIKDNGVEPLKITLYRPGAIVFESMASVPDYEKYMMLPKDVEEFKKHVKRKMVDEIADQLYKNFDDFFDITKEYYPEFQSSHYRSKIRIMKAENNVLTFDDLWKGYRYE